MKTRLLMISGLLAAAGAANAGPYDQPWTLFEAEGRSPTADTAAATVMKVDGRNSTLGRSDPYPAGKHSVEVSVPGPRGVSNPTRQTLEIDAKPCTRYRLAAKRSSPTAKDWQAFVAA